MKKPTGPAKIEILRATSEAAIRALLFNFDFDDAALKPEHQAWLNAHAVPSLKATNQRVFLRGIASQKGGSAIQSRFVSTSRPGSQQLSD